MNAMNKLYVMFFAAAVVLAPANAATTKNFTLSYDLDDFNLYTNSNGKIEISCKEYAAMYGNENEPMLPIFGIQYAIPFSMSVDSVNIKSDRQDVVHNISVEYNPSVLPLNSKDKLSESANGNHAVHKDIVNLETVTTWDGINVVNFSVSPFEYDAENRVLYFNSEINVEIFLSEIPLKSNHLRIGSTDVVSNMVRSTVLNPEDVDNYISMSTPVQTTYPVVDNAGNQIDYVIITADSLKSEFELLRDWREKTGLKAVTVAVEDIAKGSSTQPTLQLKIKEFIKNLYIKNNTKYVLLGGDDSIIPVQYCYAEKQSTDSLHKESRIASDMFYASTSGSLNWDANDNGLVGEWEGDGVEKSVSVLLSRLPIRTKNDIQNSTRKIINYERFPKWKGRMLLAGTKLTNNPLDSVQNDAEWQSRKIYNVYVKNYWNGDSVMFFDSYTTFPENSDYDVTSKNMRTELSNGYDFVSMVSHGNVDMWELEKGDKFRTSDVLNYKSDGYSIIFSASCFTNAFDSSELTYPNGSLSEAFIRGQNSGVVAYWGCTNLSWGNIGKRSPGSNVSLSFLPLHNRMKNREGTLYRWGDCCASAQTGITFLVSSNHWHWLCFNAIGDPAMPVYTSNPMRFSNAQIDCNADFIRIASNESNSRICLSGKSDDGSLFHSVGMDSMDFETSKIPSIGTIVISGMQFVPKMFKYAYIQNRQINDEVFYEGDKIMVGNSVCAGSTIGNVTCIGGNLTLEGKEITIEKGFSMKRGAKLECKKYKEVEL